MRRTDPRITRVRLGCTYVLLFGFLFQAGDAFAASQKEADELFRNGQWELAVSVYEELLETDSNHGQNWFRLARSYENLGDFQGAHDAYRQSLDKGFPQPGLSQYSIARMLMRLNDRSGALSLLEEIAAVGGPNFRTVQNAPEFQSLAENPRFQAVIDLLRPCNSVEHRQFDFWVGKWDVTPDGAASPNAANEISITQDGCVVLEEYVAGAFTGMSINFFDAVTRKWHQTWMSNAGSALYLEGGLREDGAMEMTDRDLPSSAAAGSINKTVWTPLPDGSVRQVWTNSVDNGETWTVVYDGTYRRQSRN